jgi:hypothetical protein
VAALDRIRDSGLLRTQGLVGGNGLIRTMGRRSRLFSFVNLFLNFCCFFIETVKCLIVFINSCPFIN